MITKTYTYATHKIRNDAFSAVVYCDEIGTDGPMQRYIASHQTLPSRGKAYRYAVSMKRVLERNHAYLN